MLGQMEQDKEKEEEQELNSESARIETAGLVNGDMGDGSAEQSDGHSPPHTDRTGTESHTECEDGETKTESEHRNEEGSADHKVRACLTLLPLHPSDLDIYFLCVIYLDPGRAVLLL